MKNILIVDDDTISRFKIRRALRNKQRYFKLYVATTGTEAQSLLLNFYRKFKKLPDIITISVSPSVTTAFEFAQVICQQNLSERQHHQIIVLSFPSNSHYPLQADEQPVMRFFPKPMDTDILSKILSL